MRFLTTSLWRSLRISHPFTSQPRSAPQWLVLMQAPSSSINITSPGTIYRRYASGHSSSDKPGFRPVTDRTSSTPTDAFYAEQNSLRREQEAAYQITFTCKPCGHRSSHRMSKHAYHKGAVLIRCPSCLNRHVISDHLQIFMDKKSTLEDILQQEGKSLTRGYLDGDLEFWEDGTIHAVRDPKLSIDPPVEDTP